jgi:sulfofructose kinase
MPRPQYDVAGLGLNATDTVLLVRDFPALGGKARLAGSLRQAGGQVATALVTCRRLGLRARYIGRVGDDEAGRFQLASLRREGLDVRYVRVARRTPNQLAYIVVDQATGERTVFWDRHPRLAVPPADVPRQAVVSARALHLDGCDVRASVRAARWARAAGIPVVADVDTAYEKVETVFPWVDYLLASANLLPALTGDHDPFRALAFMAREYRMRAAGMTLGRDGALVYSGGRYFYSPGFVVETVDTTGAGDVFHGAFLYGLLAGWDMARTLDFSNAMAALNCRAIGARGGISTRARAERLMARGDRHSNRAYLRGPSVTRRTLQPAARTPGRPAPHRRRPPAAPSGGTRP